MKAHIVFIVVINGLLFNYFSSATAVPRQSVIPPRPGDRPTSADVQTKLREIRRELQQAMERKQEARIYDVVAKVREALGPYAGVPEDPETYLQPMITDRTPPIRDDFEESYRSVFKTRGSRSEAAQKNQMEMREAAYMAIGCLAAADAGLPGAKEYRERAGEELDYLISRQQPEGFWGYPADPQGGAPPNMRAQAARIRTERPELIKDGFIVWIDTGGGTQFDSGCAGYALAYGYQQLREPRYLAAAKKAGDWAIRQPLATNWNYNAFSVWLLAELYSVTAEKQYLESAVEKARLGVLPGQMENGRWVDQHNAKRTYHWIMVRALNQLLKVLPETSSDYAFVKQRTVKAVDHRVEDVLRDGAVSTESSVIALSEVLELFGPNEKWQRALTVKINALHGAKARSPYSMGVYLRYAAKARKR